MTHQPKRRGRAYSTPDHRPMIPAFRNPENALDAAVREPRRRYDDVNPDCKMNWR